MPTQLTGISSMATRALLEELAGSYERECGVAVAIESVGGVDAAKRVAAGEAFDVVVLAADAMAKLVASEHLVIDSYTPLARSGVSVAVPAGAPRPDISSVGALRQAVLAASCIGYSTGPSGVALLKLFESWGVMDEIKPRLVQAPPGVPVAGLLARGEVALGFQQLSELLNVSGVELLGAMPEPVQIVTTFSAGLCAKSSQPHAARRFITYLASPATAAAKQRHGMAAA